MTPSNGNIFRVTGPLCGEFTGHPSRRPATLSFDVFFDLCLNKRLNKQSRRRWFETPSRSFWCHRNEIPGMYIFYRQLAKSRRTYWLCLVRGENEFEIFNSLWFFFKQKSHLFGSHQASAQRSCSPLNFRSRIHGTNIWKIQRNFHTIHFSCFALRMILPIILCFHTTNPVILCYSTYNSSSQILFSYHLSTMMFHAGCWILWWRHW